MTFQVLLCISLFLCFHFHFHHAHLCASIKNDSPSLKPLNKVTQNQKRHEIITYPNDKKGKHKNIFDDSLESSPNEYQKVYGVGISVTGISDSDLVTKILKPQCGTLDLSKPNNDIQFHTISRYSFHQGNPKWRKETLSYAFDWNVPNAAKPPLESALKEWQSSTHFKFYPVKNFSRADIKLSFMSGDHGDGHPFPGGGLAHSFPPPDGRVHFDLHQNWSWARKRDAYDVKSVGLHELGHILGLSHSTIFKAIMYPVIYPREKKGLHVDDINGIKALPMTKKNQMASPVFPYIFLLCLHFYTPYAHPFELRHKTTFPLEFVNQIDGVKRGDIVEGLYELKKHLSYLGYLNYNIYSERNTFDDSLESAVRKYQQFYNLNISGVLDKSTIVHIRKPRCGLPDHYNGKNGITSLHMASHYSFFSGRPKWHKKRLKYVFNTNVKEEAKKIALERALKAWSTSTPFKFDRVGKYKEADIKISYMPAYHGDGHPFVGPDAALAHTYPPPDGRVSL
ncbi:matrix metalloproteinase [Striga asiatica]|uniref:Matrix metalloproteinase n=1 Tax=Striga asiatica TaxID=4170 RepID=A0A5A7P3F9_STRAF|nr:matrix metalloproteinase [Striga asiatica]